ncbi:MAG: hypothetical protein EOP87_21990 [Verrucomicrobiaceae bacterium]|nr:MAG: hypothetical protein EOP87_21990 [Verrucomicrobiaceae bacterium]
MKHNNVKTRTIASALIALSAIIGTVSAATSMFDTDYQPETYNWAPLKPYALGGTQSSDSFRDLTWHTHGNPADYNAVWNQPSFTSPGGVTLAGNAGTSIGSYIKWGMMGTGNMPSGALLGPIQSGTVTHELIAANPITPKAIDAARAFTISTSTPLSGVTNVLLQLRTGTIFPASADYTPFQLAQMAAPVVMSLNGGTILREASFLELTHLSVDMFSTAYTQEVWAFQWNLSDISEPITDFAIHWDSHPFGNLFGAQLDQSTSFNQVVAVPEAAPTLMAGVAATLLLSLRNRRRLHGLSRA